MITVSAENDAPYFIQSIPNVTINEDEYNATINLSIYASDVDNTDAELNYSAIVNDSNVIVTPNNNTKFLNVSAAQDWNGNAYSNITVIDPSGATSTYSFMIVVVAAQNDAPYSNETVLFSLQR